MSEISILSILPPIVVLFFGYLTKRIISSLLIGTISAVLIANQCDIAASIKMLAGYLWKNIELTSFFSSSHFWDTTNLFICIFLFVLGIFVVMLQHSGGVFAYGNFVKKYIKNKRNAETSSLVLSTILFIDDYFSSLTVGSVMQPLTDTKKVPRAKLAFLVDSMAAPLAILCPFSSWVAATLGFLKENGISENITDNTLIIGSPISAYFNIIPYILYSFILIFSVWLIVRNRISFGLMHKHETIAETTGNLFGGKPPIKDNHSSFNHCENNTSLFDFFMPVVALLLATFAGMLFSGEWYFFGGTRGLISAMQNSKAASALFIGGITALLFCSVFFVIRKKIKFKNIPKIYLEGIILMAPAIIVLMLAWTLGDILRNDLRTGEFIASSMLGSVSIEFLPVILFISSTIIAFSIGSSWGTAAMVFPIAIPLVISMLNVDVIPNLNDIPILFPILGATLSGCIAGDHLSPISDTTIMSSTSSKSDHMDHVKTQLGYSIPIVIACSISFIVVGFLSHLGIFASILGSIVGFLLSSFILIALNKRR